MISAGKAAYLAQTIPGATLTFLTGVTHFAPLQRPDIFNEVLKAFLHRVSPIAP
jgi:pimeloyl-ACP methyl ester carboxylesterase